MSTGRIVSAVEGRTPEDEAPADEEEEEEEFEEDKEEEAELLLPLPSFEAFLEDMVRCDEESIVCF